MKEKCSYSEMNARHISAEINHPILHMHCDTQYGSRTTAHKVENLKIFEI